MVLMRLSVPQDCHQPPERTMPKHLADAESDAITASAVTLIFQALALVRDHPVNLTDVDERAAIALSMASLITGAEETWNQKFAVEAASVACARYLALHTSAIPIFMDQFSRAFGADLITRPLKAKMDGLQAFADSVAVLETSPDTDAFLCNIIERARDVSEERPSGHRSQTPLNDTFRRGRDHVKDAIEPGQSVEDAKRDAYQFTADAPGHEAPEGGEA